MEQRHSERKNERQTDNGQEWGGQERSGQERQNASRNAAERPSRDERPVIGITLGDYNGVGPEVILKALQNNRLQKICTPVVYGSMRVLNRYKTMLHQAGLPLKDWNLNGIQQVTQANHRLTNVITCWNEPGGGQGADIQPGKVTPEAGAVALACLQRATDDLEAGHLHALVTAPINTHNIQNEEFKFPGHTEYFAAQFENRDNLMFLVSPQLRVGVVTGHVPLGRVRASITRERVLQKLQLMYQSLRTDFGIRKPRIAVLGLNPHAGENGLLGNEENEVLTPLINELRQKGQLVYGPFPSDGFFGTQGYRKFDAVLAMYHDQGLPVLKHASFGGGVNVTLGLPIIRTSVDHGTALDLAGSGRADAGSLFAAVELATAMVAARAAD